MSETGEAEAEIEIGTGIEVDTDACTETDKETYLDRYNTNVNINKYKRRHRYTPHPIPLTRMLPDSQVSQLMAIMSKDSKVKKSPNYIDSDRHTYTRIQTQAQELTLTHMHTLDTHRH